MRVPGESSSPPEAKECFKRNAPRLAGVMRPKRCENLHLLDTAHQLLS
jgi:hypothetical protein